MLSMNYILYLTRLSVPRSPYCYHHHYQTLGKNDNAVLYDLFDGNTPLKQGTTPYENPYTLLPNNKKFWHYVGGLTTPPCTNGVQWFVLKNPIPISYNQAYTLSTYWEDTVEPQPSQVSTHRGGLVPPEGMHH